MNSQTLGLRYYMPASLVKLECKKKKKKVQLDQNLPQNSQEGSSPGGKLGIAAHTSKAVTPRLPLGLLQLVSRA